MNNKAWSHLPNAHHIDWVLQSLKDRPELWGAAHLDTARDTTWDAPWTATRGAALAAARDADRDKTRNAARDATWDAVSTMCSYAGEATAALYAAWDAVTALVAYDDCDGYLAMNYEQLRAWALLSETPQSVLLLPLKWVQEQQIGSAECVPNAIDNVQNDCYSDA